jgi:protein phosphatase 2C family protein 2/3
MSQQLVAEPFLIEHKLTEDDDYLILSSDGLWDVFTPEKAEEFVRKWREEHKAALQNQNEDSDDENAPNLAEALIREALNKDSRDNITTFVIFLKDSGSSPRPDLFKYEIPASDD